MRLWSRFPARPANAGGIGRVTESRDRKCRAYTGTSEAGQQAVISRCTGKSLYIGSHATRIAIGSAALSDDMPRTGAPCRRGIQEQGLIDIVSIGYHLTSIVSDQEFIIE